MSHNALAPQSRNAFANPRSILSPEKYQGIAESFAHGMRQAPGDLARLFEQYSLPGWVADAYGKSISPQIDEATQVNEMGYDPNAYEGNNTLRGLAHFGGEVMGDPLNLIAPGIVGAKVGKKVLGAAVDDLARPAMRNQAGMIGSTGAKTADLKALDTAIEMKTAGIDAGSPIDPDTIYKKTGWWLDHPDGRPRFEIDDSGAKYTPDIYDKSVSESLPHNNLYESYPDTANIPLNKNFSESLPYRSQPQGSYDPSADSITILDSSGTKTGKSTSLHELQHAIQDREGMATGGNPADFAKKLSKTKENMDGLVDSINKRMSDISKRKSKVAVDYSGYYSPEDKVAEIEKLGNVYKSLLGERSQVVKKIQKLQGDFGIGIREKAHAQYKSLAGETEARLVQDRMNLTMDERLANPFYKNFDVPLDEQIVRRGSGVNAMVGYHGSPHKFDKFDHSQMGTGEGAQAYGWGTYIAENPRVAGQYQKKLSEGQFHTADNKVFNPHDHLENMNIRANLERTDGDIDAAIKRGYEIIESIPDTMGAELALSDITTLQQIKKSGGLKRPNANLYEVDLPDEKIAQMLDWDAPLSEQPESVKRQLLNFSNEMAGYTEADRVIDGSLWYDADGRSIYQSISDKFGGQEAASAKLKELGIPGIKYFDGNSRAGQQGTRNFVSFDENDMTILKRNNENIR